MLFLFFKKLSDLELVAADADKAKDEKQKEIEILQQEADKLDSVSKTARSWATKIINLFKEDGQD